MMHRAYRELPVAVSLLTKGGRGHGRGEPGLRAIFSSARESGKAFGWCAHSRDRAGPRGAGPFVVPLQLMLERFRVPLPFDLLIEAEIAFLETFFRNGATRKCADKTCRDLSNDCYGARSAEAQAGAIARRYAGEQARKRFAKDPKAADTAAKSARRTAVAMSLPRLNAHLWRQLVGRGLYVSNLDWWYASHQSEDILLVCSEDLNDADKAASEMSRVAAFIGLPAFDFGAAVSRGKYNAGAQHKGYSAVTSLGDAALLSEKRPAMSQTARDK